MTQQNDFQLTSQMTNCGSAVLEIEYSQSQAFDRLTLIIRLAPNCRETSFNAPGMNTSQSPDQGKLDRIQVYVSYAGSLIMHEELSAFSLSEGRIVKWHSTSRVIPSELCFQCVDSCGKRIDGAFVRATFKLTLRAETQAEQIARLAFPVPKPIPQLQPGFVDLTALGRALQGYLT